MLPTSRHRFTIPNSLAAIATVCCLTLAWTGFSADSPGDPRIESSATVVQVDNDRSADSPTEQTDSEREQRSEPRHRHQLPDFTFFLFPGRRAR